MTEARRAIVRVVIDGNDVTDVFDPILTSLTITDGEGSKSDKADFELDDEGGRIELPRAGASVEASIRWSDGGGAITFKGKTDEPKSSGTRGGGMTLSISAHSADMGGKAKGKKEKHKDKATFKEAAEDFAKGTGITVKVDDELGAINRDYWSMMNESFLAWGARTADELGATFKVADDQAVFVGRNSGKSASGKELPAVTAEIGKNLISWDLSPNLSRASYKKAKVRHYDHDEAKWKTEEIQIEGGEDAVADLIDTAKAANKTNAKAKAKANGEDSKRGKGGGEVSLEGEPAAKAQAICHVVGVRAGIDGEYRITTATHTYTRGGGWVTKCSLEQPQGKAGKDDRKKKAAAKKS